jgi:hypothetical protein
VLVVTLLSVVTIARIFRRNDIESEPGANSNDFVVANPMHADSGDIPGSGVSDAPLVDDDTTPTSPTDDDIEANLPTHKRGAPNSASTSAGDPTEFWVESPLKANGELRLPPKVNGGRMLTGSKKRLKFHARPPPPELDA